MQDPVNEDVPEAAPRRKSLAGPLIQKGAPRKSFAVTNQYSHKGAGPSGKADDLTHLLPVPILPNKAEAEEQVIEGDVNILSATSTTKELLCSQYTEDKKQLAAGFVDGMIRLFDAETHVLTLELFDPETLSNRSPVTGIKYRPVNKSHPQTDSLTCTYVSGCIKNWNYNFQQCIYTIREKRQTFGLAYHYRLPKFVTYGDDCRLYLYDEETKTQERIFGSSDAHDIMDGHASRVFSACFNPKSNHELVSGGWDDTIQFWDTRLPRSTRYISGPHVCGDGIEISKSGKEILTCSWQIENPLQMWDYGSGKLIANIAPDIFNCKLYCGKFINKDYLLCGGCDPNLIRLVDLRQQSTSALIRGLPGGVYCLDVGTVRKSRKRRGSVTAESLLPRVMFCSAKTLYEIDFG